MKPNVKKLVDEISTLMNKIDPQMSLYVGVAERVEALAKLASCDCGDRKTPPDNKLDN